MTSFNRTPQTYDANGNLTNDGTNTYSWDARNLLTAIAGASSANGILLTYTYDNASRVTAMTWTLGSTAVGELEYQYDADSRVIQKTGSFAQSKVPVAVTGNTFNAANETTAFNGIPQTYDANGNLTNDGTNTYSWDARNHLTAIAGGSSATFAYDPLGRRDLKAINGVSTQFLYDDLNPVQEIQNGAPSANLLTGLGIDEYLQRTDAAGARDYLTDILGSSLALTDSTGTIQTQYSYDPFGNSAASGQASANSYQFTGRENDGTGEYFDRERYYRPAYQRFIAQDPIDFSGGSSNLYVYVDNNPLTLVDLFGLCWIYSQSTGLMIHVVGGFGSETIDDVEVGYSGIGAGLNNPDKQHKINVGPLPRSVYAIGPEQLNVTHDGRKLPDSMRLTPDPGKDRGGFLIHGPHPHDKLDSSNGCPVFDHPSRDAIGHS